MRYSGILPSQASHDGAPLRTCKQLLGRCAYLWRRRLPSVDNPFSAVLDKLSIFACFAGFVSYPSSTRQNMASTRRRERQGVHNPVAAAPRVRPSLNGIFSTVFRHNRGAIVHQPVQPFLDNTNGPVLPTSPRESWPSGLKK